MKRSRSPMHTIYSNKMSQNNKTLQKERVGWRINKFLKFNQIYIESHVLQKIARSIIKFIYPDIMVFLEFLNILIRFMLVYCCAFFVIYIVRFLVYHLIDKLLILFIFWFFSILYKYHIINNIYNYMYTKMNCYS